MAGFLLLASASISCMSERGYNYLCRIANLLKEGFRACQS